MKLASIIGIGAAGVFVGAVIMEVIHRTDPDLVKRLGERTRNAFRTIGDAFMEGYTEQPAAGAAPGG
jgi:hypothetical protein